MESKVELVIEGHAALQYEIQALSRKTDERFDLINFKVDTLEKTINAVASDLAAHRRDTEAHQVGYRVRQECTEMRDRDVVSE